MDKWVEMKQLQVHFVSAAGLVYKNDKVLLIRSARRGWEFPGGVVEQGEAILDGLKREICEESGIIAEPRCLAGICQRLTMKEGYGPLEGIMIPPNVSILFICDYVSGELHTSDESLEAGWFTPEEAKEMVTLPHFKTALTTMLEYNGKVRFSALENAEDGGMKTVRDQYVGL